jgi:nitroreductase
MEGFVPSAFGDVLELGPKELEPVLLLPVGYRSEGDMFSDFAKVRRPEAESILYHK